MDILQSLLSILTPAFAAAFGCALGLWHTLRIERKNWKVKRDELEKLQEQRNRNNAEELERRDRLLKAAVERAERAEAMCEGLTADLAALKAYDEEDIEKRLEKIRKVRNEEERMEELRKLLELNQKLMALRCGMPFGVPPVSPYGWGDMAGACASSAQAANELRYTVMGR